MSMFTLHLPPLQLTDEERRAVGVYADATRPGVLARYYPLQLVSTAVAGEVSQFVATLKTSGRYTRVYAWTFTGDVEAWSIRMRRTSGELLVMDYARVTSLTSCAPMAGTAAERDYLWSPLLLARQAPPPLVWDPAIILDGNETISIDGRCDVAVAAGQRSVLNLCAWVWEFPRVNAAPVVRGP